MLILSPSLLSNCCSITSFIFPDSGPRWWNVVLYLEQSIPIILFLSFLCLLFGSSCSVQSMSSSMFSLSRLYLRKKIPGNPVDTEVDIVIININIFTRPIHHFLSRDLTSGAECWSYLLSANVKLTVHNAKTSNNLYWD